MKLFKNLAVKVEEKNMFHGAVVREYLPVFHDKYMSKNRDFKNIEDSLVEQFKSKLETQDGLPIKFHKNIENSLARPDKFHNGDISFEKNGRKAKMKITISEQGFLENQTDTYIIELITDKYVYLKNIEHNYLILKSHEELEKIQSMGGLNQTA